VFTPGWAVLQTKNEQEATKQQLLLIIFIDQLLIIIARVREQHVYKRQRRRGLHRREEGWRRTRVSSLKDVLKDFNNFNQHIHIQDMQSNVKKKVL